MKLINQIPSKWIYEPEICLSDIITVAIDANGDLWLYQRPKVCPVTHSLFALFFGGLGLIMGITVIGIRSGINHFQIMYKNRD